MKKIMVIFAICLFLQSCGLFSESQKDKLMRKRYHEILHKIPSCVSVQNPLDRETARTDYDIWIAVDSSSHVHVFYTNLDTLFEK